MPDDNKDALRKQREDKRAQALRENLKRRRQQKHERTDKDEHDSERKKQD
jgi:hypothetical protein